MEKVGAVVVEYLDAGNNYSQAEVQCPILARPGHVVRLQCYGITSREQAYQHARFRYHQLVEEQGST